MSLFLPSSIYWTFDLEFRSFPCFFSFSQKVFCHFFLMTKCRIAGEKKSKSLFSMSHICKKNSWHSFMKVNSQAKSTYISCWLKSPSLLKMARGIQDWVQLKVNVANRLFRMFPCLQGCQIFAIFWNSAIFAHFTCLWSYWIYILELEARLD